MKYPKRAVAAVTLALFAGSAPAWSEFGHMVVAAVAYEKLKAVPRTRAKVDALLRLHPDHPAWTAGVPAARRGEVAFLMASRWPDAIKRDARYLDDGLDNGETPVEPVASWNRGYGDLSRHRYWHYRDVGHSDDGTPVEPPRVPNVQVTIERFRATVASPKAARALKSYDLTWLIHLVGDAHQPLHATSRFTADLPHGDVGGNRVAVSCAPGCPGRLHAFWDGALGADGSPVAAVARAKTLAAAPADPARETDVGVWLDESFRTARADAYAPPVGAGGRGPYVLDDGYRARAVEVAERRAALAGARLAWLILGAVR